MATVAPPPSKRQKREQTERTKVQQDVTPILEPADMGAFRARFVDGDGNQITDAVEINIADATEKNVSALLNTLLGRDPEDFTPYRFRIKLPGPNSSANLAIADQYPSSGTELLALLRLNGVTDPFETTITLSAEPQSVFRVRAVSRLAHRIPGHSKEILTAQWSPRPGCRLLATGSGDNCARLWDADTGTPRCVLKGHRGWVLDVRWSPDGDRLATCGMDKTVRIWDPQTGKPVGGELRGHAKWVAMLAWEPYHLWRDGSPRLASASKDGTVRIWVVNTGRTEHVLSHKASVSCVRWGATDTGRIYTASHDKLVRVYDGVLGTLVHSLSGHAHWVNHLALSTDFVLRSGFYEPGGAGAQAEVPQDEASRRQLARERFDKAARKKGEIVERVVSASDDFTMYLWSPAEHATKPLARMQGHQKGINHVAFSPDGTLIASASWDNSSKLWNARDGKFISTLRGHVAPIYQCAFSADSRLLVTASKDTTLKVWNVRTAKLTMDLVGHEDEIYAADTTDRKASASPAEALPHAPQADPR